MNVILIWKFHLIIFLLLSLAEMNEHNFILFRFCRIAQCFAFLVCTKWSNPMIHRASYTQEASSSSSAIRYLDWNSGLVVLPEDQSQDGICTLPDIGGHIMKIPIIVFQVLLCMHLEVILVWSYSCQLRHDQFLGCINS